MTKNYNFEVCQDSEIEEIIFPVKNNPFRVRYLRNDDRFEKTFDFLVFCIPSYELLNILKISECLKENNENKSKVFLFIKISDIIQNLKDIKTRDLFNVMFEFPKNTVKVKKN